MPSLPATPDLAARARARFLEDSGFGLAQASILAENGLGLARAALDAAAHACSMQVYVQAIANTSRSLAPEARMIQLRGAHAQAARGLRSAIELQLKGCGASGARLKEAMDAGAALQAAIEAAVRTEAIEVAYVGYRVSVVTALCAAFPPCARTITAVDGRLRVQDGSRDALLAATRAVFSLDAISRAHQEFASAVEAAVRRAFLGGPDGAPVQAISQLLALANMCGDADGWTSGARA